MTTLFVSSTGTGIGKTLVTCALCHQLRRAGRAVDALKPVISGFDWGAVADSDTGRLLAALGRPLDRASVEAVSPWRFAAPLSPDMAAAREGRGIDVDALVTRCRNAEEPGKILLIEGVGGAMVPLDGRHTTLDWMQRLGAPVLLVVGSYLGTLSHTLTTAAALTSAGLSVAAVVVSESAESPVPLAETVATLRDFLPAPTVGLSRLAAASGPLWAEAPDLLEILPEEGVDER